MYIKLRKSSPMVHSISLTARFLSSPHPRPFPRVFQADEGRNLFAPQHRAHTLSSAILIRSVRNGNLWAFMAAISEILNKYLKMWRL